ncbi:uncharacterized protein mettl21ca [Diretmus argenteus]
MMGVSSRMLILYNLTVRGLRMQSDRSSAQSLENKPAAGRLTGFCMDTLSTSYLEENNFMINGEEEEEEKDEEAEGAEDDSAVQREQRQAPCFYYHSPDKEVYHCVGQEIIIQGSTDSYAGMIWPAARALCHYLETHREQLSLLDKAVLEIGAGTGLLSIVAALLGAWVTATDLPDVLSKMRVNLSKNTRGHCRHTPQVAALSWGHDLEHTYPRSVYRYDYVLAADVVYHHDFLDELLVTMKHFCQPGTTLIWANKVRFPTDLTFTENFKKAFHTSLLVEDEEMKIFMATCRGEERESNHLPLSSEQVMDLKDEEDEKDEIENNDSRCGAAAANEDTTGEEHMKQPAEQQQTKPTWAPTVYTKCGKDIYHYVGQEIRISESIDYFGAVMWPAALALCSFLDTNRQRVDLQGKEVLELGAGTGLVAIVASLLGASVTATDLPEILSNLRCNVVRNTKDHCRHTPKVAVLSWGPDLEHTYPKSVYRYDYVLAADVVYHHGFLDELLVTMKHFCQPGTTLIWANKVRFQSDLTFTENFKKAFHTSLLFGDEEMKIFMATCRGEEREGDLVQG